MPYIVRLGPTYFPDASRNRPIRYGRIYIGQPDTDPTVTTNQQNVTALLEDGSEVAMSQPILTSAGGVPVYNGSPISLKVAQRYSLSVLNQSGGLEYYVASNYAADDNDIVVSTADYAKSLSEDDGNEITVNDSGYDCDFRVASDDELCAFFMEASSSNFAFNNCTLEDWQSIYTAIQIGGNANIIGNTAAGASKNFILSQNAYVDSLGTWKYQDTDEASCYSQSGGEHHLYSAVSGTADTAISWIETLELSPTSLIVNEYGEDFDVRIESALNANSLFMEGSSGNIGLDYGSLDSWLAGYKAMQFGETGNISASATLLNFSQNAFRGADWTYQTSSQASLYYQGLGLHIFQTAASGTAETTISWINQLHLKADEAVFNEDGEDIDLRVESSSNSNALFLEGSSSNLGLGITTFGGGTGGIIAMANATAPSSNPTGGGLVWVDSIDNALRFRQADGTVTQIAPFIPTLPTSGDIVFNESGGDYDFRIESDNNDHAFFLEGSSNTIGLSSTGSPSSWPVAYAGIQYGGNAGIFTQVTPTSGSSFYIGRNIYFDGSNFRRMNSDYTELYRQYNGTHLFDIGAVGAGGSTISYSNALKLGLTETIFNEGGADIDFRVESDTRPYALYIDGASGNIGINSSTFESWNTAFTALQIGNDASIAVDAVGAPSYKIHIAQNAYYDAATNWVKQNDGESSLYTQYVGTHYFYAAESDVAESTISWLNYITFGTSETVFNENGDDITFRVESDINTTAIYMVGSTGNIGFGVSDFGGGSGGVIGLSAVTAPSSDPASGALLYFDTADDILKCRDYNGEITEIAPGGSIPQGIDIVFNEAGDDYDFRIESDTVEYAFFLDGATGTLSFGNSTIENWNSDYTALQIGGNASLIAETTQDASNSFYNIQNAYYEGAIWRYQSSNKASLYQQYDGEHIFYTDGSQVIIEINTLTAADAAADDLFGVQCAVDDSNTILVVGAAGSDTAASNAGKVYTYNWNAGTSSWDEVTSARLTAADAAIDDSFGIDVSLNDDGTILVVGAYLEDTAASGAGKVYTYNWNAGTSSWDEVTSARLTAADANADDRFGTSCSLDDNGTILVVGASLCDTAATWAGKVYTYNWNAGTSSWDEVTTARLTAADAQANDYFGRSAKLDSTGTILVVGAYNEDTAGSNAGKVYTYNWNAGTSSWDEVTSARLTASDAAIDDQFGTSLGLNDDGDILSVGAQSESSGTGKVYLYNWNSGTSSWDEYDTIIASDATSGDYYGAGLELNNDATMLIVGSPYESTAASNAGKLYTYTLSGLVTADAPISWSNLLNLKINEAVFNDDGEDINFRVESETNANALFIEGSSNNIGLGITTFGGGSGGVLALSNSTAPTSNPTGGGLMWVDDGDNNLYYRDASGNVAGLNVFTGTDSGDIVFNESGGDYDFRVETDTEQYALFIEGSSGNIGFGMNAFGGGVGIIAITNAAAPSTDPIAGGFIWVDNGDSHLYYRDANSNVVNLSVFSGTDSGDIVFNESGGDYDFRVESDTNANALFIEGSSGNIGVGTNTPSAVLTVQGYASDDNNIALLVTQNDNDQWAQEINGNWGLQVAVNNGFTGNVLQVKENGGIEFIIVNSSGIILNDSGSDIDIRVESSITDNALFIEGSSGNVGIGNNSLESWSSGNTVIQVGGNASLRSTTTAGVDGLLQISHNLYYDGDYRYQDTDEACLYQLNSGAHVFYSSNSGTADTVASLIHQLTLSATNTVFNEGGADIDFRVESDTITNAIYMDGATGIVSLPACYSHDMNGETYRDLLINDSGELGYDSSTIRKKTNVVDMENVDWVYDLRPVNFEYKKRDDKGTYLKKGNGIKKYGLIAEELESVNSDFVFYDEDGRTEGIHYREFIPVLIKALQDQKYEIEHLKMRLYET